jgi:serine/threonine protein kinase
LIGEGGRAKICDTGLTRLLSTEDATRTTTPAHIGTMRYMAHELIVADEEPVTTPASDVYALACLGLEVSPLPFFLLTTLLTQCLDLPIPVPLS